MIMIEKKVHTVPFLTVWFAKEPLKHQGIVLYREAAFVGNEKAEPFDTLISDLTETEEEMKQHLSKSCKYKVNRAPRENVTFQIKKSEELTDEEIGGFLDFFQEFWESKGVSFTEKEELKEELLAYRELGTLTLSTAYIEGKAAVYHTHLFDQDVARLLHSASLYREIEKNEIADTAGDAEHEQKITDEDTEKATKSAAKEKDNSRNLVGMANRYLHFEEMKYFKQQGIRSYDWGGAGKGEDVLSITEFKESFGGEHVTFHDFTIVTGLKAKLVTALSNLRHRATT